MTCRYRPRSRSAAGPPSARLLEATVDCLVEHGWAGTTTTLIAERAGVSRGAQLHHYPTKAALVARRGRAPGRAAGARSCAPRPRRCRRPAGERLDRVVDLLAAAFTGPLFVAALELWVAARTDPELRDALVPLEARVGREMHRLAVELLGADESPARRPRGRAGHPRPAARARRGQPAHRRLAPRRDALLAAWKRQLAHASSTHRVGATMVDARPSSSPTWPRSRPSWTRWSPTCRAADWTRPTPAAGWTIAHQIAHLAWTDHAALLAVTDPDAFYGAPRRGAGRPGRLRRPRRGGVPGRAGRAAGPLARRPGRAGRRAARGARRARKLPWYGTADVAGLDGHRPDHGDLGARPGRRRRARRRPARPTARLRHVAHLGFRTLGHGFARPRPAGARRAGARSS